MSKVKITIDEKELEVEQGLNLIEAAKQLGVEIPHYCYHSGLSPDGNCRMCLVHMEKAPKPVPACKTGASEGMVVKTQTPEVQHIRKSVMEFLLLNHPLDCPTCDQAGECRLQDYYMDYDRIPSRYQEEKVHKDKMVNLGAGVMLDEERCIVCTRCVRFCREIAKDEELYVQERGNHSMVATFPGKEMSNPYAGNVVDVCPVGALTSKDFRYKKRVWYLNHTDSICPGCSRGCNMSVHHEEQKVYRLKPRLNPQVNNYWMCDAGRYDYKFVNEARRLKSFVKAESGLTQVPYESALDRLMVELKNTTQGTVAVIASAQESNQEIDAFIDFAKTVLGTDLLFYSKNDPENSYSDDILINADKNPNTKHCETLGLKPVSSLPQDVQAVLVQRSLSASDQDLLMQRGVRVLALFATNETKLDCHAEVIFPLTTYVEQQGSFTNFEGHVQDFLQAYKPRGEAKMIKHMLGDLSQRLRQKQAS